MDVIAERTLEGTDENKRTVTVRIGRPEERGSGWICTTEIEGYRDPGGLFIDEHYGADSAGALLEAITGLHLLKGSTTYKGKNPWPIAREPDDLLDTGSALGLAADVVIERELQKRNGEPVTFRIRKPVQHGPSTWSCVFEWTDADGIHTQDIHGVDSAQALFLALDSARNQAALDQLSRDGRNPWEIRTEPLELLPWKP